MDRKDGEIAQLQATVDALRGMIDEMLDSDASVDEYRRIRQQLKQEGIK